MFNKLKHIILLVISLAFLSFGILVLESAYGLNDPFSFVMTFFAANLMILISAALALGFFFKLKKTKRQAPNPEGKPHGSHHSDDA